MTTTRLLAVLLVASAATVAVARTRRAADADPATRTYEVTGVVTAPPEDGRVSVAHEDIPGYMPAMTMPFRLAPGAPALAPGDRVRFRFRVGADWSHAERVVVTGRDPAIAAAAVRAVPARPRLKKGDPLPPFSLVAQDGRPFTAADLRGRPAALTFIFTRCPVPEFCPLMVQRFQQIQRELQRDPALKAVQLLSVTLDPGFDTPPVLDAYAKAMAADPARWRFVTGTPAEIERLTRAFGVHSRREGVLIEHTLATAVVDADGRVTGIWRGNGWKAGELVDGLREAARTARRAAATE